MGSCSTTTSCRQRVGYPRHTHAVVLPALFFPHSFQLKARSMMEDRGSKHRRRLPLVLGAVALGAGVAVALIAGGRA